MKRPRQLIVPNPTNAELATTAERAIYVGSVEHKAKPSWLGPPQPRRHGRHDDPTDRRQNATICPLVTRAEREKATGWVQEAIAARQFDKAAWDGEFPRHIWYKDDKGHYWQGRCTQRGAGDEPIGGYKGWPITEDEWDEVFG